LLTNLCLEEDHIMEEIEDRLEIKF
jgi:hypothetical protein